MAGILPGADVILIFIANIFDKDIFFSAANSRVKPDEYRLSIKERKG